jgi:hypothetical protein
MKDAERICDHRMEPSRGRNRLYTNSERQQGLSRSETRSAYKEAHGFGIRNKRAAGGKMNRGDTHMLRAMPSISAPFIACELTC